MILLPVFCLILRVHLLTVTAEMVAPSVSQIGYLPLEQAHCSFDVTLASLVLGHWQTIAGQSTPISLLFYHIFHLFLEPIRCVLWVFSPTFITRMSPPVMFTPVFSLGFGL